MAAAALIVSMPAAAGADDLPPCGMGRIVNFGTLSLSDCSISGQSTTDPGGGIENYGTLALTNVVIDGNHGAEGGGIYNGGGDVTLTNVIIRGNLADGIGGGIYNDGGAVFLTNVTIVGNIAGAGGGGLANLGGASTIGAHVAVISNATLDGDGGGVLNDSSVCLSGGDFETCFRRPASGFNLIRDNQAAGNGGGIANVGSIVLSDSSVDANRAQDGNGGGVWNGDGGTTQLLNVTVSRNNTTGHGGGIFNGGFAALCCATLATDYAFNLTIAGNHAGGHGGGLYTEDSAYTGLASTTIADNTAGGGGDGVYNEDETFGFTELKDTLLARHGENCVGGVFSAGHNLDTGISCGFGEASDITNVQDAHVGLNALAANGGPDQGSTITFDQMMTLALTQASPAVDAGSDRCPAGDERGVSRPQIAACDIGAFELEPRDTFVVTATITAASKMYDATTAATLTGCTLVGADPQDDVSCVASDGAFDTATVGTGKPVTATVTLTGSGIGEYQLSSDSATTTADITLAPAAVTPNAASKIYGTADPALTGTLSGFLAVDHVTAVYSRTAGETVAGSPYTISATLSPSEVLVNYDITYNTAPFTITAPPPPPSAVTHGDTATIGFWQNKNGQAVLTCLNGGPNSTALGNYLASTYPSLFGSGAGSLGNLANKKNSEIAAIYKSATYFGAKGQKVSAQTIGVAFATYVTSSSLSGGTNCGAGFGFSFGNGTGTKTYNVGSLGTSIGLSNNTSYTVFELLQAANAQKAAGIFNANAFNVVFDGINRSGDI
jgi:hypothetical protein